MMSFHYACKPAKSHEPARCWSIFTFTLCTLWLAACATAPAAPAGPLLHREVVIDGLKSPWSIAFLSGTEALITEKEGGLLRANLVTAETRVISGLPADLVTDIRATSVADNGGLFDVVLHPEFATNQLLYLSYAAQGEKGKTTKVVRATLQQDSLTGLKTILVAEPYTENEYFHYGGGMVFGPDGKLYITIGERLYHEKDGPALPIAQDPNDRRGKIFRLNDDGSVPGDNPTQPAGAVAGVYALGIRAAQGITLHPHTGEIWFSEHGSQQGDEINRLVAGANYGWPIVTSGRYRDEDYVPPVANGQSFTAPIWTWRHTVAPTGLTFYFGQEFPQWQGDLLVAGLSLGSLWRLNFEDGVIVSAEELLVDQRVRTRKVATSPDGTLYLLTDTLLGDDGAGRLKFSGAPGGQLIRLVDRRP
jgi:glucose/arabinose dehydrogenase